MGVDPKSKRKQRAITHRPGGWRRNDSVWKTLVDRRFWAWMVRTGNPMNWPPGTCRRECPKLTRELFWIYTGVFAMLAVFIYSRDPSASAGPTNVTVSTDRIADVYNLTGVNAAFVTAVVLLDRDNSTLPNLLMSSLRELQGFMFCDISSKGGEVYTKRLIDRYKLGKNVFVESIPWTYHFAVARNLCIERARALFKGRADYYLVLNGDEVIRPVTAEWRKLIPRTHHVDVRLFEGNVPSAEERQYHWHSRMFHASFTPRYQCAAFDYPATPAVNKSNQMYFLDIVRHPGSQEDRDYRRHRVIEALERHLTTETVCYARNLFYLGQAYFEDGQYDRAQQVFYRRMTFGEDPEDDPFPEERYYAAYRYAVAGYTANKATVKAKDADKAFKRAWKMRPWRAEAIHYLTWLYYEEADWMSCWELAKQLSQIELPRNETLLLGPPSHFYHRGRNTELVATCAFNAGHVSDALEAWNAAYNLTPMDDDVGKLRIYNNIRKATQAMRR